MNIRQYIQEYHTGKAPFEDAMQKFSMLFKKHGDSFLNTLDPLMHDSDLAFSIGSLCYRIEPDTRIIAWLERHAAWYRKRASALQNAKTDDYYDAAVTMSELAYASSRHKTGIQR